MVSLSIMCCDEAFTPRDSWTLGRCGAATLVEPGDVLARLAADVPCVAGGPAGELHRPAAALSRPSAAAGVRRQVRRRRPRCAPRDTDLSKLEPNKLITPNELAYIRTEMPAAAAEAAAQGPWMLEASGLVAQPAVLKLDDLAKQSKKMGPHLFECSGNASTGELRVDERGRMGRHPARRSRRAS